MQPSHPLLSAPLSAFALVLLPVQDTEIARIQAPGTSFDGQGVAMACDGERLLVGAPFGRSFAVDGSAHLFEADPSAPSGWREVQRLEAPGHGRVDRFGDALDIDGDLLAVGAWREGNTRGATYVFERPAGGGPYTLAARLAPGPGPGAPRFGYALALDGNRLLVGAPRASLPGSFVWDGRAFVYERDPASGAWDRVAELRRPPRDRDERTEYFFGFRVALEGDVALVATEEISWDPGGEVHVFVRDAGAWQHRQILTDLDAGGSGYGNTFGRVLALRGDDLFVAETERGLVHVFRRAAAGPEPFQWVTSLAPGFPVRTFYVSLAVSGERLAFGVTGASWRQEQGQVQVFERVGGAGGTWEAGQILVGEDPPAATWSLGMSVVLHGDRVLAGEPALSAPFRPELGGVRVFALDPR